jgi:hypothetical protein
VGGNPLDFSFLHLKDVESLNKENPRSGKRRPCGESDDEDDNKKRDALNPILDQEQ